jgi:asparagine synthase (glutamine-hydrolysing)
MCGIAGFWKRGGKSADTTDIAPMLAAISHRGPDGEGSWHDGHVALGHRRLTILDTSERASQPMVTDDGQGVLTYNGETYNFQALRRELEAEGHTFRSTGDTEVVLTALHHWGPEKAIPRFNGMFALAYFDRRDGALWLARDRLGIKTLVTADIGDTVLFASEVKALLAHPGMPRRIDGMALIKWIVSPRRHAHRLLFESVDSVAAGSWWKISADGIEKRCYFHILDALDIDRLIAARQRNFADLVDEVESRLIDSVGLHLASDVPLAAMCSGGVDSSLVAAYAKQLQPDITAYVADIDFAGSEGDQAELVGNHLGVPVERVAVDRERYLRGYPECVWHSDGPLTHPSDPALLAVTRACRANGVKVLLTGEGSDELFGGYSDHVSLWRKLRHLELLAPILPSARRKVRRLAAGLTSFEGKPREMLDRNLALAIDADEEFVRQRIVDRLAPIEPLSDRAFLAFGLVDLYGFLTALLHRHDRLGMAASMEMRVPFIENQLIDFATHLPRWAKVHRRQGKRVVKQAAARRLPPGVVYAPKKGFPAPGAFVRGTGRLLVDGRLAEAMEWNSRTTKEIVVMLEADRQLCFRIVSLELWLRQFFSGEAAGELGERLVAAAT